MQLLEIKQTSYKYHKIFLHIFVLHFERKKTWHNLLIYKA